jgi:hypothetical protein
MMLAAALSLMVLAALALAAGAVVLWRRGERQRPLLMVVLIAVLVANVAVWTMPDRGGTTPIVTDRD